jgi:hypothetical protein
VSCAPGTSEARGAGWAMAGPQSAWERPVGLKAKGSESSSDSHSSFSPSASARCSQCLGHQCHSFSFPPAGHMFEAQLSHTRASQPSALQRWVVGMQSRAS